MIEAIEKAAAFLRDFGPAILFWGIAALVLATAAYAVLARKIDHGAFSLMACFSGVAGLYALLGNDFLAVAQVVVYVGGIMVLIVFGVLLTDRLPLEFRQISRETAFQGLAVALPVAAALLAAVLGTSWAVRAPGPVPDAGTTREIGQLLLTDYLFPFEFASVVLLVALVGAARLARGGRS